MAKYLAISVSASGDTTLVAAQGSGSKIQVLQYTLVAAGAVSVKFISGTTDKTGAMPFAANGGIAAPFAPQSQGDHQALIECGDNEALKVNLSGAVLVAGHLVYDVGR